MGAVGIRPAKLGLYYAQAVSRFGGESKSRPTVRYPYRVLRERKPLGVNWILLIFISKQFKENRII